MRNPLIRRIPRELKGDFHKYIVIIIFMVLMIGVISGMYVGHDSMLAAVNEGREKLNLEDGSFELSKRASQSFIEDISTGKRADVRKYFIDKGIKEADKEVEKALEEELNKQVTQAIEENVREMCNVYGITDEEMVKQQIDSAMEESYEEALSEAKESKEYKKAADDAYKKAQEEVEKKVDEEWDKISDRYELEEEYNPSPVTIYENFYRDAPEDNDGDGDDDATVRLFKSDSLINSHRQNACR